MALFKSIYIVNVVCEFLCYTFYGEPHMSGSYLALPEVTDKYWQQLLHPERTRKQPPKQVNSGLKRSASMTPDAWKMWSWMRDLPTKIWNGRGWVPTADGDMHNLAQLPGGGWGMTPGAGVWEGQGQVPVAGKRRRLEERAGASPGSDSGGPRGAVAGDPQPRASGAGSSQGPPSVSGPSGSQAGSSPTAGPACGVRPQGDLGINWESRLKHWMVQHRVRLGDRTSKQMKKCFFLGPHRGPGVSEAEAREAALRAAREYRDGLAASGVYWGGSTPPGRSSGVSGVHWCPRRKHWKARVRSGKDGDGKSLFCKCFKPADNSPEEVERARLQAVRSLAEASLARASQ